MQTIRPLWKWVLSFFLLINLNNCTSWPGLILLLFGGGGGKSGMLIIPPGGGDSAQSPSPPSSSGGGNNPGGDPGGGGTPSSPSVTSVTSSKPSGNYKEGEVIDITLNFSEPITADGPITITLNNGETVTCSPPSETTITCTYTVGTGSGQDANPLEVVSVNGNITNSSGTALSNGSNLAGATPLSSDKTFVIDNTAPTISHVTTTTPDGYYGAGATITIQVVFNEIINVSGGPPQLTLNTTPLPSVVDCTGTSTNTLTCSYTIKTGDVSIDLDYETNTSFALNGATITDLAGNPLTSLTLPNPGATGSLAANSNIQVDGTQKQFSLQLQALVEMKV